VRLVARKLALLALVAILLLVPLASSQRLTVRTDRERYEPGDIVVVEVEGPPNAPVGIEIRDPIDAVVLLKQLRLGKDGKASFEFQLSESARPGNYTLYAATPGSLAVTAFRVGGAGELVGITIVVLDPEGQRVEGAVVDVEGSRYTAVDGTVEVQVEPGVHEVRVFYAGVEVYRGEVDVAGGEALEIAIPLYCLRVEVRDFLGRPASGAAVELLRDDTVIASSEADESGVALPP